MRLFSTIFIILTAYVFALSNANGMSFTSQLQATQSRNVLLIRMAGQIDHGDDSNLNNALAQVGNQDVVIELDSNGGLNEVGFKMIQSIQSFQARQANRGRLVAVYVSNMCASMCLPVFYSFQNRFADPKAMFGFHASSNNGEVSQPSTLEYVSRFTSLAYANMDSGTIQFLANILNSSLTTTDMTWFTSSQLASLNALILRSRVISFYEFSQVFLKHGSHATVSKLTSFNNSSCNDGPKFIHHGSAVEVLSRDSANNKAHVLVINGPSDESSQPLPLCEGDIDLSAITNSPSQPRVSKSVGNVATCTFAGQSLGYFLGDVLSNDSHDARRINSGAKVILGKPIRVTIAGTTGDMTEVQIVSNPRGDSNDARPGETVWEWSNLLKNECSM